MVVSRSAFKYQDQILIEKFKILPPFRYEAIFQNTGCFIYFKEKGPQLLSSEVNIRLKGNEAVLLKCGSHFIDILREAKGDQIEAIVIHLFPNVLKKLYTGDLPEIIKKQSRSKSSQVVVSSNVVEKFIDSLEFYFQNPSLVNNDLLELKVKELILLLVQSKNIDSIMELVADLYSSNAVQVREVVELHLFSNLKLDELAKLCNLSLSSFKRGFRKEFNDSPTNYINGRRIEKAKELLSNTELPISEIAYETGFQDSLYFTRLFKNKIGVPPTTYRKKSS